MTRPRSARPLLRLAATALVAVAVIPLSGCLYAQIPADPPAAEEPTPTESDAPIDEPDGTLPTELTFAAGAELPGTAYIEWGDGFMTADGWETVSPDDGNGGWIYGTVDGTCTAQFWQGLTSDVPVVAGDDSASSDAILAALLDSTTAEVTPLATTGEFSYQVGGTGGVENRQVSGAEADRTWIIATRAFTATGVGLYVIIDCTNGDADAVLAEVVENNAVVVTP
ncbi:MAG: hypothetical protein P0Y60_00235 [Candidatus Microbacterium colombiense]|nr:MAG: hypothetical protein P0Y60_00235 [Microbacterium sp.]